MEAFMYKIHPQTKKIMEIIQQKLNAPLDISAEFCFSVDVPETHRLVNRELGGGSILDIGCYPVSISRHAVGAANGKNPIAIIVPCHRVIGHGGDLKGYAYGIERKKWLLKHENSLLI